MKGDFTRNTFNRNSHYSRVLMQQGRVQLDADWNEQAYILLDYLRSLAKDLIGPHGGPGKSFQIGVLLDADGNDIPCDFSIYPGHYYVDGILCAIDPPETCPPSLALPLPYTKQPDYPLRKKEDGTIVDEDKLKTDATYLVYLDVWERHITYLQNPYIREVALGGPDTATRAKTVCQVKVWAPDKPGLADQDCDDWLSYVRRKRYGCLRARALIDTPLEEPCIIPPEARYRGPENQLYRVEIHNGGQAEANKNGATFKWSRDNGSVVFAIRSLQGSLVTVNDLGPDTHRTLKEGDWVEIVDDVYELRGEPGLLLKVEAIDPVALTVTLQVPEGVTVPVYTEESTTHPLLRRWESKALPVEEKKWLDLEDGVQVYFKGDGRYETGDYWIIPARTATGDVEWPGPPDDPVALPPHGIKHHLAPLAMISLDANGEVTIKKDCRCSFEPLCKAVVAPAEEDPPKDPPKDPPEEPPRVPPKGIPLNRLFFRPNRIEIAEESLELLKINTAKLADEVAANVLIQGSAWRSEKNALSLANNRALAVRNIYVERGITSSRLSIAGNVVEDATADENEARHVDTIMLIPGKATPGGEKSTKDQPRKDRGTPALSTEETLLVRKVSGIGPKSTDVLNKAGITKVIEVARMEPKELAGILDISDNQAVKLITNAKSLLRG